VVIGWLVALAHAGAPMADLQLVDAAVDCDVPRLEAALDAGASPDAEAHLRPPSRGFLASLFPKKRRWTSALYAATGCALGGRGEPLEVLLRAGATVDGATEDRPPPVHRALAAAGRGEGLGVEVAARLVAAGARPTDRYRGRSAAHALYDDEAPRSDAEAAAEEVLVDGGVAPVRLLCAAASDGDVAAVDALVERWPDAAGGRCPEGSPLIAAVARRRAGALSVLLEAGGGRRGVDAHRVVDGAWVSPLVVAVADGWDEGVALLVGAGASPDAPAGPPWARALPPLGVALSLDAPAAREAVVRALVHGGAERSVWAPPTADGEPWRSVFTPGDGLPGLAGPRPLSEREQAVAEVSAWQADPAGAGPYGVAVGGFSPPVLSRLLWQAGDQRPAQPLDLTPSRCGPLPAPRDLRRAHGAPEREGGRWAQRWRWGEERAALVVRDRWPGRWEVVQATGPDASPCTELVGLPAAAAVLRLGPPTATGAGRLRWGGVLYGSLEVEVDVGPDGTVDSWQLLQP